VIELEIFQIFLPYSFRLIGSQTKQGNMHPWWVKIGFMTTSPLSWPPSLLHWLSAALFLWPLWTTISSKNSIESLHNQCLGRI